jgi:response regulator of citrate/malate metabolism
MNQSAPTVLIIDDDPGVLFLHKIIVREGNLCKTPITFSEAEKALDFILPIDTNSSRILIFLDINMPKIDGWKFLELLEEKVSHADIRVVMVTSSLSKSEREKANDFSLVIDYWEKPMNDSQVSRLKENLHDWLTC